MVAADKRGWRQAAYQEPSRGIGRALVRGAGGLAGGHRGTGHLRGQGCGTTAFDGGESVKGSGALVVTVAHRQCRDVDWTALGE
jgi:hypothetical protein